MLKKMLPYLKNKYILLGVFFVVWIIFFDTNRMVTIFRYRAELREVRKEKAYYLNEIEQNKTMLERYKSDNEALEKLAREKYKMKKDNEDVFLIVEDQN